MAYKRYTGANPVWSGAGPGLANQDIDLSSQLDGSDRVIVVLAYGRTSGSSPEYATFFNPDNVRTLDEDFGGLYQGPDGAFGSYNEFIDEYSIVCCLTSGAQVVRFHGGGSDNLAVHLIGYFTIDAYSPKASGAADFSYSDFPDLSGGSSWGSAQTTDLSSYVGSAHALVALQTANQNDDKLKVFRPANGDFGTFNNEPIGPSACYGGEAWGGYSDQDSMVLVPTDSSGRIEGGTYSQSVPSQEVDLYVLASAQEWKDSGTQVGSDESVSVAGTFETLDMSAVGHGSNAVGAYLHVRKTEGAGTSVVSFRPSSFALYCGHGDSSLAPSGGAKVDVEKDHDAHVFCPTGDDGDLEWTCNDTAGKFDITVIGYVDKNDPPTISGEAPTGGAEGPSVTISFDSADVDGNVSISGIDLELTSPFSVATDAIVAGSWQPGWSGTIAANGSGGYDIDATTHPPFHAGTWQATATVTDDSGEVATSTWSWTVSSTGDVISVSGESPKGSTIADLDEVAATIDGAWGIDTSTIALEVTVAPGTVYAAIDAGAIQAGWAGSIIELGDIGDGPRRVLIRLSGWPELAPGHRCEFALDATDSVGGAL